MRLLAYGLASAVAVAASATVGYTGTTRLAAARIPQQRLATATSLPLARVSAARSTGLPRIAPETLTTFVRSTCGVCHNDVDKTGGISFETFDVAKAASN